MAKQNLTPKTTPKINEELIDGIKSKVLDKILKELKPVNDTGYERNPNHDRETHEKTLHEKGGTHEKDSHNRTA